MEGLNVMTLNISKKYRAIATIFRIAEESMWY